MPRTTRNQRRCERQRRAKRRESEMTPETIATVRIWLDRMAVHARNAVDAARTVQKDELAEDNHLFWAIVKYAENVQESVVQLDKINESIFHALEEFPIESHVDELNWTDLKGMRIRLAHKFWDIDPDILWTTVTWDFPSLPAPIGEVICIPGENRRERLGHDRLQCVPGHITRAQGRRADAR